ncbi:hypothetical protein INT43_003243 [Umbelopsis isabellina]|uniref:Uncharacterized protein n=1 Tax=Mortierella isabellina TaxID=91625 RepID=A0A8H7PQM3_MORIS|nr:hypothetical protein INT43_003243 [Umbelopsis isabellina]
MRPDEHKAKASRRYQSKHKKQGDPTALEVAQARRAAAKAKVAGNSLSAIRRRNADIDQASQTASASSEPDDTTTPTKTFSRRKIASNKDRYEEKSEQDQIIEDAELGIDRETTDLVRMLEEKEAENVGDNSTFFRFKEEQEWEEDDELQSEIEQKLYHNLLALDITELEAVLSKLPYRSRLHLADSDRLVPQSLDMSVSKNRKPIVPGFVKNAKGLVMFKKPVVQSQPQAEGIMITNDGSNHEKVEAAKKAQQSSRPAPQPSITQSKEEITVHDDAKDQQHSKYEDDLDSLLNQDLPADRSGNQNYKQPLKRPNMLKKPVSKPIPPKKSSNAADTDDAWLDEMLE